MSLSKINFQKIDSHEAVTALVRAIADVIKNPPDMKEAVDESHRIIRLSKDEQARVDADRLHLNAEATAINDGHKAKQKQLDDHAKNLDNRAEDFKKQIADYEVLKSDLENRKNDVALKEKDLKARDLISQQREKLSLEVEGKLRTFENTLQAREKFLEEKERNISERESKLRQLLG